MPKISTTAAEFTPSPLEGEGWGWGAEATLVPPIPLAGTHPHPDLPPSRGKEKIAAFIVALLTAFIPATAVSSSTSFGLASSKGPYATMSFLARARW